MYCLLSFKIWFCYHWTKTVFYEVLTPEQTEFILVLIKKNRDVIVKEMNLITFNCHAPIVKLAKLFPLTFTQV